MTLDLASKSKVSLRKIYFRYVRELSGERTTYKRKKFLYSFRFNDLLSRFNKIAGGMIVLATVLQTNFLLIEYQFF
jgi:hypothetical protein